MNDFQPISRDVALLIYQELEEEDSLTRHFAYFSDLNTDENGFINQYRPLDFSARENASDSPCFHEAMRGPDSERFYEAMVIKLDQPEK
mmetsp:Transcript_17555/g.26871  ORF Transcript_17555/g.26871 Transcript_17555/m.26871 type:complete len:89 (-) Transcript_17555:505-771(-)